MEMPGAVIWTATAGLLASAATWMTARTLGKRQAVEEEESTVSQWKDLAEKYEALHEKGEVEIRRLRESVDKLNEQIRRLRKESSDYKRQAEDANRRLLVLETLVERRLEPR